MTSVPSAFSGLGLSISLFEPYIHGGYWAGDFSDEITDYSHEKAADMYFVSCDFTVQPRKFDLDQWLLYTLGRRVLVKGPGQQTVWEGFVNQVKITYGQNTWDIGPLSDIANRVWVTYTPVYLSASNGQREKGTSTESALVNDSVSQAKWGIWEKNLSAGECLIKQNPYFNEASNLRAMFLAESSYPKIQTTFSYGQQGASVQCSCLGYWKYLDAYIYNYRAATAKDGYSALSTKLLAVLAANPNSWTISTDYGRIATSTVFSENAEIASNSGLTIIKAITAAGDAAGNRWVFGVRENQQAYYNVVSSDVKYQYRTFANEQRLVLWGTDQIIEPWDIQPGYWYQTDDTFSPVTPITNFYAENRAFIESVKFSTPYGLELSEGNTNRLAQILAAKGLGSL